MNKRNKYVLTVIVVIIACIILSQIQTYKYPKEREINLRTNYLERVLNEPLEDGSEIMEIDDQFWEWMLFSYSFSSFAYTNLALHDSTYKSDAEGNIRLCINRVLENEVTSSYSIETLLLMSDSIPDYSILYLGHLNLMLGCYRILSADTSFNKLNDRISESLFHRYSNSKVLNLESYAGSIWIPDNTCAIASLKLHDENTGSGYDTICSIWTEHAKSHYIDKETGVLCTSINPINGEITEGPRGSMLGWSIMFIYQFDSDFALELYQNYKKHFSKNYVIFRLFKERYNCKKTDIGDIDSGPIFMGFSIPANEFALCDAVLAEDYKTAQKLKRLINFGTKTTKNKNELKYKVRFIDMNISPMAEALVLYSLTITKWTD